MIIKTLNLENFRCIKNTHIELGDSVNFFFGENGSGKSSVLESLHVLATGRSFRTSKIENIRTFDNDYFSIFSKIKRNSIENIIGLRKEKSFFDIRINSKNINRLSELALYFSIIIFHANSINLVEGEPIFRRRYIDWWLFHSDSNFYGEWLRYQKILKHRNAELRTDYEFMRTWDEVLAESGEKLNFLRLTAVDKLMNELTYLLQTNDINIYSNFSWRYNFGWSKDESLFSSLKRNMQRDTQYGFTSVGPHRSDLKLFFHGKDAKETLSRGQQKTLSLLMLMALASLHKKVLKEIPVFLIDDLSSELDVNHRHHLMNQIVDFGGQVLATAINENDLIFRSSATVNTFRLQEGAVHML